MKLSILSQVENLKNDLFHTLFPNICLGCNRVPKTKHAEFCVDCLHTMPYSDHFIIQENDVTNHFRGRISLHHGAALLRFSESGMVKNILHRLKYKKCREIGEIFGHIAGQKFLASTYFELPDLVIPVPIHTSKEKIRGYNQSSIFGRAVAQTIGVEFRDDLMIKSKSTASQTGMSRTQRVDNVKAVFELTKAELIPKRHILIVDDVVTTGATLEACCLKLIEAKVGKISVLTLAAAT